MNDRTPPDAASSGSAADARRVLAAAAADWDRLAPLLDADPGARDRLVTLLTAYREGRCAKEAAAEAARLLHRSRLGRPGDFAGSAGSAGSAEPEGTHETDGTGGAGRFGGAAGEEAPSVHGFVAEDLVVLVVDGHRMAGPVLGAIRERLLDEPAVGPGAVRARGQDPDSAGLIRLTGAYGRPRLPLFQFDESLRPHDVVLDVNRMLRADSDPWGVADWWLSANAWLGTAPVRLLGSGEDGRLLDTARLLTEGD